MIKKTRFLILVSLFGSVAYNIPRFFEFQTTYDETVINDDSTTQLLNYSKVNALGDSTTHLLNDSKVNVLSNSGMAILGIILYMYWPFYHKY